jgi:hypothetical protein
MQGERKFHKRCLKNYCNVDFNPRNCGNNEYNYLLDKELYQARLSVERTNTWMDSFRSILKRFVEVYW